MTAESNLDARQVRIKCQGGKCRQAVLGFRRQQVELDYNSVACVCFMYRLCR